MTDDELRYQMQREEIKTERAMRRAINAQLWFMVGAAVLVLVPFLICALAVALSD